MSVTAASPAKMAELIEMPFGMWSCGLWLSKELWSSRSPMGRGTFDGNDIGIFLHAAEHHSQWL